MIIKFTETAPLNNKWNSIFPCEPHLGLEEIKIKNGKSYKLLGKSEKTYFLWERICLGIRTLAQTVLTLGAALCFEKNRSDWESFWTGKRVVVIYTALDSAQATLNGIRLPMDDQWKPPLIPSPLNKTEETLRAAKQAVIDQKECNPHHSANRYRIYYTIGGMLPGPDPRGYKQCSDNPWKKACETNDLETMKTFLSNPFFKRHLCDQDLEKFIDQKNIPAVNALLTYTHTRFSDTIFDRNESQSFSILNRLIRGGAQFEGSINLLLDQGYDVNLLEDDFDEHPEYQKLSKECQLKIWNAREINKLDPHGYTALELAIGEGDLDQVMIQLNSGACINHQRGRPLRLAIEEYMKRIPGNVIQFCSENGQPKPDATDQELLEIHEIIRLILQQPLFKMSDFQLDSVLRDLGRPHKTKEWDEMVTSLLSKVVNFDSPATIKNFVFSMPFEQMQENSPIFAALSEGQKAAVEQFRNVRFIEMLFELNSGHKTAEVYRMLQNLWGSLSSSKMMTQAFSGDTISKLTQSIENIPTLFEDGDEQKLLNQIQEGLPVIIPFQWSGHVVSAVFYKNTMILGNRGERAEDFLPGLHVYKYDQSKLTPELLQKISDTREHKKNIFTSMNKRFIFEKSISDELCATETNYLPMSEQTVGNCTWASSAYLGFFSALYCLSNEFDRKSLDQVHTFVENEFEPAAQLTAIQNYIKNYKDTLSVAQFEHNTDLFGKLFNHYYEQIEKNLGNEHSPQYMHALEAIDTLVYSGLTMNLRLGNKEERSQDDKNKVEWLEKRYQLPWDDRLQYYLTRSQIDFSPRSFEWGYNSVQPPVI